MNNRYDITLMDRNKKREEGERYLERCVEVIKGIPVNINEKKDIAFKAEILSCIIYKERLRRNKKVNQLIN